MALRRVLIVDVVVVVVGIVVGDCCRDRCCNDHVNDDGFKKANDLEPHNDRMRTIQRFVLDTNIDMI
jgi:hypothetical protein